MEWFERRLSLALKAALGDPAMIVVPDHAPYHHVVDVKVGVPESNTKAHNTVLLRNYGAREITVQRDKSDVKGGKKVVTAILRYQSLDRSRSQPPCVAVVLQPRSSRWLLEGYISFATQKNAWRRSSRLCTGRNGS